MRVESRSTATGGFGAPIEDLYRHHAGEALQLARSITRNPDDAADAVAEAFAGVLSAVSGGRTFQTEAFRPYLLAATRHASIDILRRAGRLTPTDESGILDRWTSGGGPSDRLLAGEDRALVAEAFAELPPRWRAVLWLTEVEGLAPRDAAPLLELSPNNVAQLAVRARARLRQRYVQMHVRNHAAGDCLEATEHLGGLVAGELTTTQATRVRGHLAECGACRDRLAEIDDLGLCLRRSALPLAAVLHRLRPRWWPWRSRGGRLSDRNGLSLAGVDPSAVGTVGGAVAGMGSSPVVQHVAGWVAAGLLIIGGGAAAVRHQATRPSPDRVPVERTAPATPTSVPPVSVAVAPADPPPTSTSTVPAAAPQPPPTTPAVATSEVTAPFTPRGPLSSGSPSSVAEALGSHLGVYDQPGAGDAVLALANPQPSGAPLVLLVTGRQPGWLQVLLPVRPNGSTGWIRADEVSVVTHDFRIVVELGAHRLTAYRGTEVILSEPVGIGTRGTPTPGGLFYTKELFQPLDAEGRLDPGGPYGPFAYGLSGYSDVLFDFAGGDGQFGIHGTNDPSGLGRDVSAGCIRMSNAGITRLAGMLPLGVPVEILP